MNVRIIATHDCSHYRNLERELKDLAVVYEVLFVEDHPEIVERYSIRHSPSLVVDDEVVFRRQLKMSCERSSSVAEVTVRRAAFGWIGFLPVLDRDHLRNCRPD